MMTGSVMSSCSNVPSLFWRSVEMSALFRRDQSFDLTLTCRVIRSLRSEPIW